MCFVISCLYGLSINTLDCLCRRLAVYISPTFQVNIFVPMVIILGKEDDVNIFNVENKYDFEFTKIPFTLKSLFSSMLNALYCEISIGTFMNPGLGST